MFLLHPQMPFANLNLLWIGSNVVELIVVILGLTCNRFSGNKAVSSSLMTNQWTSGRLSLNVSETIYEILIVECIPFLTVYLNLELSSKTFNKGREVD